MAAMPMGDRLPNDLTAAEQNMDALWARESLNQLPAELAEVVVLKLWGELTFEEIGKATRMSTASAHRKYNQAIKQLERTLSHVES